VPLTGPGALSPEAPERRREWIVGFLEAIAAEAADYHELLRELERRWFDARGRIIIRRGTSRAGLAVDVLAAAPLMSATTLARAIGMSVKRAIELLDRFVAQGVVVEVTHRSARRLFGLSGMAPMREATIGPRRPMPGRGRGRSPRTADRDEEEPPPAALPPINRIEWPAIDYAALDAAMAHCDEVVRNTRRVLRLPGQEPTDGREVP
jgi:hypothetical protein